MSLLHRIMDRAFRPKSGGDYILRRLLAYGDKTLRIRIPAAERASEVRTDTRSLAAPQSSMPAGSAILVSSSIREKMRPQLPAPLSPRVWSRVTVWIWNTVIQKAESSMNNRYAGKRLPMNESKRTDKPAPDTKGRMVLPGLAENPRCCTRSPARTAPAL